MSSSSSRAGALLRRRVIKVSDMGGESFSVDKLSKKDIVALKKALGMEEA